MQKRTETPKSELEDFKQKTFLVSTLHGLDFGNVVIEDIKELNMAEESEFEDVFERKCLECCKVCDFSVETADKTAKEKKSQYLIEFEKVFSKPRFCRLINEKLINAFLKLCKMNLGRSFPDLKVVSSVECPDNVLDVSWPHLSLVYKALNSLLCSKMASKVSDQTLVTILSCNMLSSDQRERQMAKECLSSWCSKAPEKQRIINVVLNQIGSGKCSSEILEFIYDVVPDILKLFPKDRVFRSIMKLHNSRLFMTFAKPLTQCMVRFIRGDASLIDELFVYLANHWPTYGIKKQVMLTEELESVLQNFSGQTIARETAKALFDRMSMMVLDPGVDVAEAALSFLIGQGNEANLLKYIDLAMAELVPGLNHCRRDHWNVFIRDDARIVLELLAKANADLFAKEVSVIKNLRKKVKEEETKRLSKWESVMKTAHHNDPEIRSINTVL